MVSGIIIFVINFLGSKAVIYFMVSAIAIFSGWITISVAKKFNFTSRKAISNSIISSCGAVFNIVLISSVIGSLGSKLQNLAAEPDMAAPLPTLFGEISLFGLITISALYLVLFNLLTVRHIVKEGDNKELKYYGIGLVSWMALFFIARFLTSIIISTGF